MGSEYRVLAARSPFNQWELCKEFGTLLEAVNFLEISERRL